MFQKQSETTWLQLGLDNRNANNKIQCTRLTNSTANRTIKLWKCKTKHNSHETIGNLKERSWLWSSIFWYEELALTDWSSFEIIQYWCCDGYYRGILASWCRPKGHRQVWVKLFLRLFIYFTRQNNDSKTPPRYMSRNSKAESSTKSCPLINSSGRSDSEVVGPSHSPKTVTHPSTHRARRRVTSLIESISLPLRHQQRARLPKCNKFDHAPITAFIFVRSFCSTLKATMLKIQSESFPAKAGT